MFLYTDLYSHEAFAEMSINQLSRANAQDQNQTDGRIQGGIPSLLIRPHYLITSYN